MCIRDRCGRVDEIIPENAMIKVYRAVFLLKVKYWKTYNIPNP